MRNIRNLIYRRRVSSSEEHSHMKHLKLILVSSPPGNTCHMRHLKLYGFRHLENTCHRARAFRGHFCRGGFGWGLIFIGLVIVNAVLSKAVNNLSILELLTCLLSWSVVKNLSGCQIFQFFVISLHLCLWVIFYSNIFFTNLQVFVDVFFLFSEF